MAARALTTRSFDDGRDRWRMVEAAPAPRLAGRLAHYVDYEEQVTSFSARRELAGTAGVLLFVLGDPLELIGADGGALTVRAGEAFVGGIADATSVSRGAGRQRGVHVFMPLPSLAATLGCPLAAISNRVVPMKELVRGASADICGRLAEADGSEARLALLDAFFARQFAATDVARGYLPWAFQALANAREPSTTALAAELGWSRKHFTQRFRDATGFTPDRFRRLARFERFAAALRSGPDESLAELAAEAGYADQAHLTREVTQFARTTPGELKRSLIPDGGGVRADAR